jgi:probable rRNA maturation factor
MHTGLSAARQVAVTRQRLHQPTNQPGRRFRPTRTLALSNRQRLRRVDLRWLRRIAQAALGDLWPDGAYDLAVHIAGAPEITRLNETFLKHAGSTDVITFDYVESAGQVSRLSPHAADIPAETDRPATRPTLLHGEIFVCLDEAVSQARRFHTTWQSELVRYVVHGLLHLLGYDDQTSQARRQMKRAEDALVHDLAQRFNFLRL